MTLMAVACGAAVANLYYARLLLSAIAHALGATTSVVVQILIPLPARCPAPSGAARWWGS